MVILNPVKRDYYRQRFDVAHELGHLVMHGDAEPGGRRVEDQANKFAAQLPMPADAIAPELPTAMNSQAWLTLARLKEQWGVSIQALLYRARQLGRLSDVSYRNAVLTLTGRGWRRDEPGLMTSIEQPSLLPHALEVLDGAGISKAEVADQSRVPLVLFDVVTSRVPTDPPSSSNPEEAPSARNVVSLLPRLASQVHQPRDRSTEYE